MFGVLRLLEMTCWNNSSMATRLPGREEENGSGSRVFRDLVSIIIIIIIFIKHH